MKEIKVEIDSLGRVKPKGKGLGQQYENNVTKYVFELDASLITDSYFYYIVVVPPSSSGAKQYAVPLIDTFEYLITTAVTQYVGTYKFCLLIMSKELEGDNIPIEGVVNISNEWEDEVIKGVIAKQELLEQVVDGNIEIVYRKLLELKDELEKNSQHASEMGNYAKKQGDYAKEEGDNAKKEAGNASTQAEHAKTQGDYAKEQGDNAKEEAGNASTQAEHAKTQGDYAKEQGDNAKEEAGNASTQAEHAKTQGDYAKRIADKINEDKENGVYNGTTFTPHIDQNGNLVWTNNGGLPNPEPFNLEEEIVSNMQGQIDRLRANQIQGTASGTEIVIQDSAEMESILQLSGNSEQDSRSGKNLLPNEITTQTINGVTITRQDDGTIIANGTATDRVALKLGTGVLAVDEYMLSGCPTGGSNSTYELVCYRTTDWVSILTDWGNGQTYNNRTADLPYQANLVIHAGTTVNNLVFKPMLSTEGGEYEAYGVQPSPDYPSEIRSVKSKSDNLFDIENYVSNNSEFYSLNGDNLIINKTDNKTTNFLYTPFSAGTYILSLENVCKARIYREGSSELIATSGDANVKTLKFTLPTDLSIHIKLVFSGTLPYTLGKVQINKGDKALPYQPYGYVPVEVKVEGKNLLNLPNVTSDSIHGINYSIDNQKIKLNGTTESGKYPWLIFTKNKMFTWNGTPSASTITGKADGIIFTGKVARSIKVFGGNTSYTPAIALYDETGAKVTDGSNDNLTETTNVVAVGIYLGNGTYTNYTFGVQIEEGSTATPYEPYVKPTIVPVPLGDIELNSVDDVRDAFKRVNGVWNKVEKLPKYIFTGSESGYIDATQDSSKKRIRIATGLNTVGTTAEEVKPLLSNIGKAVSRADTYKLVEGFSYDVAEKPGQLTVYFEEASSFTKYADYLQWFISKNPYIILLLATPNYTPITDQALISALDELEQLILHKGYNRITATAVNGVKAYLDLSYVKDINTVINDLTAAILTLGGELNV